MNKSLLFAATLLFAGSLQAQDMSGMHDHHMHHGNAENAEEGAWRMPPMDMSMPMAPGMEDELPPVGPFLPGANIMAEMLPEARPAEVVALQHGDTLHLEASLVRRTFNEKSYIMYGYNGMYPGPLIKAPKGSTVFVDFTNNIELPTTIHWHGLRHDYRNDGIPGLSQPPMDVGDQFTYELHFKDTGIFWYHPHMREDIQQDLGLYGNMLVEPPEADYYSPVNREEVLILDDILMDENGMIPWGDTGATHALMGRFGNVMLLNGQTHYRLDVQRGEVIRFYLTNVANSRTFNLVVHGAKVKIIGSDVGKFEREAFVSNIPIAPAERYIIEAHYEEAGTFALTNTIQAVNHFRGEFYPHVDTLGYVAVAPEPTAHRYTTAFEQLRVNADVAADLAPFRDHLERAPDIELELDIRVKDLPLPVMLMMEIDTLYVPPIEWNDAMPMMNWISTDRQVTWILRDPQTGKENMDIHWRFQQGDVVKLRLHNEPGSFHPMNHPFHVHGQRFLVTHIDGVPNPNMVWKDTAIMPVGSIVDILIDMSNPGEWMMHCHIAEHLEAGMMLHFSVEK